MGVISSSFTILFLLLSFFALSLRSSLFLSRFHHNCLSPLSIPCHLCFSCFEFLKFFLFSSSFSSYSLFVLYLFRYPFFSLSPFSGSFFFFINYIYIRIYDCLCMFPCSIRFFLLLVVFIVYHAQSFSYPSLCWSIFLALCFPFLEGLPLLSPIFFLIPHMFFFSVQIWKKQRQNRKTTKRRTGDFKLVHPLPPLFLFHGSFSLSFPCSTSTCLFLALTKSGLWNMPETILEHEGVAYTQHLPFLRLEEIRREPVTRTVLWSKKRRTCWQTYSCYLSSFSMERER